MWCDNLDGKPDRVEKCKFSTGSRRAPNPSVPSTTQYRKGKSVPKLFLAFTYLAHIYLQTKKESTKSIYSHIIIVCWLRLIFQVSGQMKRATTETLCLFGRLSKGQILFFSLSGIWKFEADFGTKLNSQTTSSVQSHSSMKIYIKLNSMSPLKKVTWSIQCFRGKNDAGKEQNICNKNGSNLDSSRLE